MFVIFQLLADETEPGPGVGAGPGGEAGPGIEVGAEPGVGV